MATINVKVSSKREANKVLTSVYNSDSTACFCGKNAVSGYVLTAIFCKENMTVEVSSNYFNDNSLISMFEQ